MIDVSLPHLLQKISTMYGVEPKDVLGGSNERLGDVRLIDVRHVFSKVAFSRDYNYSEIGRFLNVDHSTIQYYCKERPVSEKVAKAIHALTNTTQMIQDTAKRLSEEPEDEFLKNQMLRLLTFS